MTALLSRDEIVRGLVAAGVNRKKAEWQADLEVATRGREYPHPFRQHGVAPDPALQTSAPAIAFPVTLVLPWSHLVSDNQRHGAIVADDNYPPRPRLIMTAAYREAKGRIMKLAREELGGADAYTGPLRLEARVWLPNTRKHDVCNFAKAVHDALQKIVYVDDSQLHDVRWLRAGVDVDHPRAEVTITPLPSATA